MKNKDDLDLSQLKEKYNLWWEYLRRSDLYRIVCESIRQAQNSPGDRWTKDLKTWSFDDFNDKLTTIMGCVWGYVKYPSLDVNAFELYLIKHNFKKDADLTNNIINNIQLMILCYYPRFQDIYHQTFDDYWNRQEIWLLLEKDNPQSAIKSAKETIAVDLRLCKESYEKKYGREPSANELIGYFQYAFCETDLYKYLKVEYTISKPVKEIKDDFYNKVSVGINQKYSQYIRQELGKRYFTFSSNIHVKYLRRYLKIYDLKQIKFLKWNDIIYDIYPKKDINDVDYEDVKRELKREYAAAKVIIGNVEQGYFPRV